MPAPRPPPHPVFTSKLPDDGEVRRLSFSELATGLYDVLLPLLPSESASTLVLHNVVNVALVCVGLRQACFVEFREAFKDGAAGELARAAISALASLVSNRAIDGKRVLIMTDTRPSNAFALYRKERVQLADVLAALPSLGYATDGPRKDLWLPGARSLGYPIFTEHPEEINARDQWRVQCAAVFKELGTEDRHVTASFALYHARYGKADIVRARKEIEEHANVLNAAIAGQEVAGFRIDRLVVLVDSWADVMEIDHQDLEDLKSIKGAKWEGGGYKQVPGGFAEIESATSA